MKRTLLSILLFFLIIFPAKVFAEDLDSIKKTVETMLQDLQTLEKAVYNQDTKLNSSTTVVSNNSDDVLTKHLLKLSELEEQFRILTNSFEEINFKLDKLSNRITKVQADNQMRFQDLEQTNLGQVNVTNKKKKKKLPGSDEPQDLGGVTDSEVASMQQVQQTQSIETVGTVITEEAKRAEKILPDGSPEKQYEFAIGILKVGDYETAEYALREFLDSNPTHKFAGSAQYWYGETFRVRQLYQDAAAAYLDGYQKYPKSSKAPINLLKLGVMLAKIGEKDQGCSMILGVKSQYPEANQSVIQKAEYETKKFNCKKKS
tara:strand:+ start:257 stop:1207 length:951 start_codon:yes stop_codon:yes gene_type:complete